MNNNGYVWVKFSEKSQEYIYAVPLNIDPEDIQRYVLVENAFYDPRKNISPYTVAKVIKYNRDDCGDKDGDFSGRESFAHKFGECMSVEALSDGSGASAVISEPDKYTEEDIHKRALSSSVLSDEA